MPSLSWRPAIVSEPLSCSICQEEFKVGVSHEEDRITHLFHAACVKNLVKEECPVCRCPVKHILEGVEQEIDDYVQEYDLVRQTAFNIQEAANGSFTGVWHQRNLIHTIRSNENGRSIGYLQQIPSGDGLTTSVALGYYADAQTIEDMPNNSCCIIL